MKRVARIAMLLFVMVGCGAGLAWAQASGAPPEGPYYAEFDVAASLGHTSDASVGAEVGRRVTRNLDGFFEGGHIGNAATKDYDSRGQKIANAVDASFSGVERVNYFDFGVRYHVPEVLPLGRVKGHPYLVFGLGVAAVRTRTTLSVDGTAFSPEELGVQLGADLDGSFNKLFVLAGGGITVPLVRRYFLDLSYRYGHVSEDSEGPDLLLAGIHTQRVQLGVGLRF